MKVGKEVFPAIQELKAYSLLTIWLEENDPENLYGLWEHHSINKLTNENFHFLIISVHTNTRPTAIIRNYNLT